jgi:threonine dehydrogenase-like Zn-dependent dehydrogenase
MTSRDAIGDHGTQNALVFRGVRDVRLERVPIPTLRDDADAIVAIDLCGLCGSDMHPYHGREQGLDAGTTCGHEFVGRVAAVGAAVRRWRVGDRVMSPFTTCCGGCFHCRRGLPCRCPEGKLFGWVEGGQGLQGAQAEFVRVPLADARLAAVPAGLSDEEALLLGDVFSTGFFAADNAGIKEYAAEAARRAWAPAGGAKEGGGEGPVVAVVGCGPVGLMAVIGALELGAARVFAVDSVAERLDLARRFGAVPVDRAARDPGAALRAATDGRGADVVIEAVGAPEALSLALELVRDGGALSSCGCHSAAAVPLAALYNKNLTLKSGRCPARWEGIALPVHGRCLVRRDACKVGAGGPLGGVCLPLCCALTGSAAPRAQGLHGQAAAARAVKKV